MKKSKISIVIGIAGILLLILTFVSPLLIMYYAGEQYFIDQYKKNKIAFEDLKNKLLLILENEKATELNLVVCNDGENGRLLQHYDRSAYSVDYSHPINANGESYNIVDVSLGDFCFSKIYVTQNYICLSEESNNCQYIYLSEYTPESAYYVPHDDKIHKLGDNWYRLHQNKLFS